MRFDLGDDIQDVQESAAGKPEEPRKATEPLARHDVGCLEWLEVALEDKEIFDPCNAKKLASVIGGAQHAYEADGNVAAKKVLVFSLQCRFSKRYQTAARAVEKYLQQSQDSPYVRSIAFKELGQVNFLKGDLDSAEKSFTEALRLKRSVCRGSNMHVAITLHSLGLVFWERRATSTAQKYFAEALSMWQAIYGSRSDLRVSDTLRLLGAAYKELGKLKAAETNLRKSLSMSGNRKCPDVAFTLEWLGVVCQKRGNLPDAVKHLKLCLSMRRGLYGDAAQEDVARTLGHLASIWCETGNPKAAEKDGKESLGMMRAIHGDAAHAEVAQALHELGNVFQCEGDLNAAEQNLEEALSMKRAVYGDAAHEQVAKTLHELGTVRRNMGLFKAAEGNLAECLAMRRTLHTAADEEIAMTLHSLGKVFWQLGNLDSAEKSLTESLSMMWKALPKGRGDSLKHLIADAQSSLGKVFLQRGDLEAAEASLTESLRKQRALYGDGAHLEAAFLLHRLGLAVKEKDAEGAEKDS